METKLVVEQLRSDGYICEVLKINENRRIKSLEYIDVQNGFDYLRKIVRFALRGYTFHVHVAGGAWKGYVLALLALLVNRAAGKSAFLTFHGGYPQPYFPRPPHSPVGFAFKVLFALAAAVRCDSDEIKRAIESYGISPKRVAAIAAFSPQYLTFPVVQLPANVENFLTRRRPVFFCYVCYRPEYRLEVLRRGMANFRQHYPNAGFIWLGFPQKELRIAEKWISDWLASERDSLLLLGNVEHPVFLTLLQRCFACIRTPACDGVSASVLEALAMGIPVIASENHRRPAGVITYQENDPHDLCSKLLVTLKDYQPERGSPAPVATVDNVQFIIDWLLRGSDTPPRD